MNAVAVQRSDGTLAVFVVNRSAKGDNQFTVDLGESASYSQVEAFTLHDDDLQAANTAQKQERVVPYRNRTAVIENNGRQGCVTLPPVSWTMLLFA